MNVKKFAKKEILKMQLDAPSSRVALGQIEGLINLGAGDPDFNQPEFINKAVYEAMREGHTHYAFGGDPQFKAAIAEYYKKYGVTVDPSTQVLVESGGSQAIFRSFGAILDPGDEILIMDPAYQGYNKPAAYFGAKMTRAEMTKDKNGLFRPDMENIKDAITNKTKAALICNPDNPCGAVYTQKELEGIAEIAVDKDIIIIADEIYTEYVWDDGKHRPIINLPGMWERTMVLMSFSKTFAWTGCRAGYIIAGPELMKIISAVPIGITSMPVPFQKAGIAALEQGWDFVEKMRGAFRKRIDFFVPRLNEIEGVSCPYPEGAFYVFADISELKCPSKDFSREFFHHEKVRCAPGTQYGPNGEGHIRFALVRPVEQLEEVAVRLERFTKNLPEKVPNAYP
ncbi:MAG: pyridoxal phosphate-dependent aminotransferase [Candidatus Bathyarchaeota archaeon]|jgi:aminotransferase